MGERLSWEGFLQTPEGRCVQIWEENAFARISPAIQGDHALQIAPCRLDGLGRCPIGHTVALCTCAHDIPCVHTRSTVIASALSLPFPERTFGFVTWLHGPDCAEGANATLGEIVRVLEDNGVVALSFFLNRGLWSAKERLLGKNIFPDGTSPVSLQAMKAMLRSYGLAIEGGFFGIYGTHADPARVLTRAGIEAAGDRWWPTLANVAVLIARKSVMRPNFVGKIRFQQNARPDSAIAVTQKSSSMKQGFPIS